MSSKLERHAERLSALGHPLRLTILRWVVRGGDEGLAAGEIQSHVELPASTLSHHLKRLVDAGLLLSRLEGTFHYYSANYPTLRALADYVWEDCCKSGRPKASRPRVEPAAETDWEMLEALTRAAGLPRAGLAEQFPRAYAVARGEAGLIGVAGLQAFGCVGLLRSVVVAESRRGAGLGRALVFDRLAAARATGLEGVYLLTSGAAPWFRSLGFEPALRASAPRELAESPEFAGACPASADCLFFPLGRAP